MKIEIWCEGMDLHGEQLTDIVLLEFLPIYKLLTRKLVKKCWRRRRRIKGRNKVSSRI